MQPQVASQICAGFPIFRLPAELRSMIFQEVLQTLRVKVHDTERRRCCNHEVDRRSSYCDMLCVSKRFRDEANAHFLSHSTFFAALDCCPPRESSTPWLTLNMKHLVLSATLDTSLSPNVETLKTTIATFEHRVSKTAQSTPLASFGYDFVILSKQVSPHGMQLTMSYLRDSRTLTMQQQTSDA